MHFGREKRLGVTSKSVGGTVRVETGDGAAFVARVLATFPGEVASVTVGRPTLEDVFLTKTGRAFSAEDAPEAAGASR